MNARRGNLCLFIAIWEQGYMDWGMVSWPSCPKIRIPSYITILPVGIVMKNNVTIYLLTNTEGKKMEKKLLPFAQILAPWKSQGGGGGGGGGGCCRPQPPPTPTSLVLYKVIIHWKFRLYIPLLDFYNPTPLAVGLWYQNNMSPKRT